MNESEALKPEPFPEIRGENEIPPTDAAPEPPTPASPVRLASIDAYRGFVMFLMMGEVLRFRELANKFKTSELFGWLAHHQTHVEWVGCSLHDLIQPSFSFLVGAALPFSIASRAAKGQSKTRMTLHAAWRALVLTALGVFLRSGGRKQTNFTFEDTLSQIGLGYLFLFVLGFAKARTQAIVLAVILVGYWAAFAAYPLPDANFDYAAAGASKDSPNNLTGFAAHWNKNTNPAWRADTWFLNQFPRETPWKFNGGGYSTLSFIPTLGTMILGLLAGNLLKADGSRWRKVLLLALYGGLSLAVGYGLGMLGVCPVVKKIWTPSWVLFSGGWCLIFLSGFYLLVDICRLRPVFFPLIVVGMNSIAAYCLSHLIEGWIDSSLKTHGWIVTGLVEKIAAIFGSTLNLGTNIYGVFGPDYASLTRGVLILFVLWLMLFWMYRRKLFLRV